MDCRSHAASAASQAVQVRYSQERSNSEHIRLLKRTDFASSLLKWPYGPHIPCTASPCVPILQDPALLHSLGLLPSARLRHLSVPTPGQPHTSGVLGHLQLEKPERMQEEKCSPSSDAGWPTSTKLPHAFTSPPVCTWSLQTAHLNPSLLKPLST